MPTHFWLICLALGLTACTPSPPPAAATSPVPIPATNTPLPLSTDTPQPTKTSPPTPTLPAVSEVDCILPESPRQTARVVAVIDGDTIDVSIRGLVFRVRYLGMDTPETPDDRFGPEATTRNRQLVSGQMATLVRDPNEEDFDIYGRMLRYIIVGDIFVNYQLLREGFSFLYPSGHTCGPQFLQAYDAARADALGLFAPTPLP